MTLGVVGLVYLALGFAVWFHAWSEGATTHTLCGCGDPALFLWFFQWPATALAHGQDPFFSTAMFHPTGVNLLAQTSVMGESVPLVPVTWIWGPVASLNVASTVTPALTAFFAFWAIGRWVRWTPAAFLGGLLYGFSPFVLTSLEFAHLMTAALMLLPLILVVLDEILIRQHRAAWTAGLALALLLLGQFFLSTELLAITVLMAVVGIVILLAAALVLDRAELRRRAPHAAQGLAVAAGAGVVLLAWPLWFALDGPAHLSGQIWPNVGVIGGFRWASFTSPLYPHGGNDIYLALGGYEGAPLGSGGYLGWGLIAVLAVGSAAFWRDRRLWFFGAVLVLCVWFSIGHSPGGTWAPSSLFAHLPLLDDVIEQRFLAIGYLAAALLLALVLDHVHDAIGDWRLSGLSALAVGAVALVPIGATFVPKLPFSMRAVLLPRWYSEVAPTLPAGRVLLSYPAPFSGIQSAMSWQAVNRMHYSQAGGGGPQGVAHRAGTARPGFTLISALGFGIGVPLPTGTAAQYAAVRHALATWEVTTVVVATDTAAPALQQGHDPTYAAAFFTGALGRPPRIEAGAWVWNNVQLSLRGPLHTPPGTLARCVAAAEGRSGRVAATPAAPRCVVAASAARPTGAATLAPASK
jgi:hypothetical protein